ncbi:hypothetical protein CDL15_Pgr027027 [Punica granatum]|uniref:S-protein homolog n=1 Tax=Punica granatum TaxID=22663 RepID=A0A218WFD0_PUNGR|nr:hypothetical protein CDL15_Pgr027027 [Punica granatum]
MAVAAEAHLNWWFKPREVTVVVFFDLPNGASFNVHCKSGDDDVGLHVMGPNQKYQLRFALYLWERRCSFEECHGLVDIRTKRDNMSRCKNYCRWQVTKDGILGFRQNRPDPDN